MPKKTRKEKIIAEYRKRLHMIESATHKDVDINPIEEVKKVVTEEIETMPSEALPKVNPYFFSDMKRSLILIMLILVIETGLFFSQLFK